MTRRPAPATDAPVGRARPDVERVGHPSGDEAADLAPRARLGDYQICTPLGSGGMATVYLAQRGGVQGAHRFVAIKRLHPRYRGDPTFRDLFLDEARIASMLQHPHVCGILDFDASDDTYYLVMEYLRGESLTKIYRALAKSRASRPIGDWPILARIVSDAAEGLHAAHELRDHAGQPLHVIHRDVSLDNVYVTYDGVAKIIDFGVAKATNQVHRTSTGILMGKHAYMAPESLRGRPPDRRVDVWALGAVLWELLTGRRLFRRPNEIDTLRAVLEMRVTAPSEVRPGLPRELDAIVLRALSRDPAKRFPTTRALGHELMTLAARTGQCPGFGDIADWLGSLCPGAEVRKREILVRFEEESERPPGRQIGDPDAGAVREAIADRRDARTLPDPNAELADLHADDVTPTSPWVAPARKRASTARATASIALAAALAGASLSWAFGPRAANAAIEDRRAPDSGSLFGERAHVGDPSRSSSPVAASAWDTETAVEVGCASSSEPLSPSAHDGIVAPAACRDPAAGPAR